MQLLRRAIERAAAVDRHMDVTIRPMGQGDIEHIERAFAGMGWRSRQQTLESYLREQERGERLALVACWGPDVAGYATVKWRSDYPPFADQGIPVIMDLNVFPGFRRRRIASKLADEAERRIFERFPVAGIGVGMYSDYGPAQRMYVRRGYIPDGRGLTHGDQPVTPGDRVTVDDHLILYFTKERPKA